jgi:hypothetical protein
MSVRSKRANWAVIILGLLSGVAASAQSGGTSPTEPAALDPALDRILTRLEEREVADLHANLAWRQEYAKDPEEDWVVKRGEIWYQKAQPVAKFMIRFTEKVSGTRRDKLDEQHLFDGFWYVELQSRTKTVQRHEIRRPNDPGNPYKVGQGYFPLPCGQKKADILNEFDVRLLPPADKDPPGTDHLFLVPRAGTNTGQSYKQLDFWVDRAGLTAGLPTKVRVAKLDGTGKVDSYITITFTDAQLNQGFSGSIFEIKVPPGYTETIETLQPIAPPAPPGPPGGS